MKGYSEGAGMKSHATPYNEQYTKNISGSCPKEFSQDYMVKKSSAKESSYQMPKKK